MMVDVKLIMTWVQFILLSWLLFKANSVESRNCSERCGELFIQYPFGMSKGCYFNKWFEVTCDNSSGKAFLSSINLQLLKIDFSNYMVQVNVPVISSNCGNNKSLAQSVDLSGTPFTFSPFWNRFIAMGCDNYAEMRDHNSTIIGRCLSFCANDSRDQITSTIERGCSGPNCCEIDIPSDLKLFNASVSNYRQTDNNSEPQQCRSAFVVERTWFYSRYQKDSRALSQRQQVPAMLLFGVYTVGNRHICICNEGSKLCEGSLICLDTLNGDDCTCPYGYSNESIAFKGLLYCTNYYYNPAFEGKKSRIMSRIKTRVIPSGTAAVGMLFLTIGIWWLCNFWKRMKKIKLRQKFFKRNGGLLLQQQTFPNEGNIEKTKLFTSEELEKATDNYNANRVLGQGGQGTVFKGMLTDGRIVAIKKSKIMDENNIEQFINEVVILSQINHRNVVKLLGCCLEIEVPLLVYEFVPNGALSQYIHDQHQGFPITWEMRLRIATEVANAISYMHSAASLPIYHRDIKSTNILLDNKYRAKVSDFGCSRSIAIDQTHLTTQVKGTFGYFDPEYFRSSHFTAKSDVYSFGVVLVELLTGQKPIRSTNLDEDRSLASYFIHAMKENQLFEVLDARVLKEGEKEEIITFANIAEMCLQLNGKKRPTMREVAIELGSIKSSNGGSSLHLGYKEIEYTDGNIIEHFNTNSSVDFNYTFSVDTEPKDAQLRM